MPRFRVRRVPRGPPPPGHSGRPGCGPPDGYVGHRRGIGRGRDQEARRPLGWRSRARSPRAGRTSARGPGRARRDPASSLAPSSRSGPARRSVLVGSAIAAMPTDRTGRWAGSASRVTSSSWRRSNPRRIGGRIPNGVRESSRQVHAGAVAHHPVHGCRFVRVERRAPASQTIGTGLHPTRHGRRRRPRG